MSKTNLKTLAYNTIRRKIITCEYAPGAFINEEMLTTTLNISRTPIRDAISRLEQDGLVQIIPKKGITVTPLSMKDINTVFEARKLYETYILQQYGAHLSEERLTHFYRIFSQPADSFTQNYDHCYELDAAFHQMIIDACANPYLCQGYALVSAQSERFRFMTGNMSDERIQKTFLEHNEIIRACLQKDIPTAVEKLIYHIDESKKSTFMLAFDSVLSV